jgi:cytochrome d ubiquinol oxidase subunit II
LFEKPLVYVFAAIPLLGVLLVGLLLKSLANKEERTPFIWTILIFLLSFIGLGLIVFPYIIPTQITIYQAAASPSALVFMIVFMGILLPIMIFYNIYNYVVFRGKVVGDHYGE